MCTNLQGASGDVDCRLHVCLQGNPHKIERKYRRYSHESMLKAYNMVNVEGLAVEKAARMFGVPAQTLRDRVRGQIDPDVSQSGTNTVLTLEQEEEIVKHVETMAELGYGYSNIRLKTLAGEMVFELKRKKDCRPMSNNWLYGFLKRWSNRLTSVSPRKLESTRAKCSTPEKVKDYYAKLEAILVEHNLMDKPHFVFNLDETGLQPDHRPPNMIAGRDSKAQAITSPRSTTTTLIACINALGHALPPFFVFKGKRFDNALLKGASLGAKGVMSDSGWSNAQIFRKYLEEHFLPYARPCATDKQPILLIYDGHTSHKTPQLISWAREQGLILFVLPAHTSHLLQPLDVAVFGPLKNYYYAECSSFMFRNIGQNINRFDICALACKAYLKAMTPSNIQAAFRKTGIFPLNQDAIPMEKLFPCENFREDRPIEKVKALKSGKDAVEQFLQMKESNLTNNACQCSCTKRKLVMAEKPQAGGRAITDEDYISDMHLYEQNKAVKTEKKGSKKRENIGNSQPNVDPKPSTSGIQVARSNVSTDYDSDDVDDTEVCCVCQKFSPPNLSKQPMLKIVNWAQCDRCTHWTHLAFCTDIRVVRRHSAFLCPHCAQ